MKTVNGRVVSTTSVSLSKAASVLSNFVSTDTGASNAIVAYLHRASEAFNELTQLHKELKPDRKHKKKRKSGTAEDVSLPGVLSEEKLSPELKHKKKKEKDGGQAVIEEVKVSQENELSRETSHGIKHDKREKEKSKVDGLMNKVDEIGNVDSNVKEEAEGEKGRHKKKKKRDKDKNKIGTFEENGSQFEIGEEERKGKRKSQEVVEDDINSEEHRRKKKKRKSEGDS